jgi:single stranded DNA-binding protein
VRGLNHVVLAGNVSGSISFGNLPNGAAVVSFLLASDRATPGGGAVTAWVKVNVYREGLVNICDQRLEKGAYVLVEGELMNRDGVHGQLTEVRAREIIFL